jgi:pimeloyl-ACP methyl ester carboxylesterase
VAVRAWKPAAEPPTWRPWPGSVLPWWSGRAWLRPAGWNSGCWRRGRIPLALCLHGFPDSAHTWRHLLPALAEAGFHAVAPFLRGYAPIRVPDDACYSIGALVADVVALHQALDGDGQAVLIGHDWGAEAAYGAATFAPDRWPGMVTSECRPWTGCGGTGPLATTSHQAQQPTLYLHGSVDGCIGVELVRGAKRHLAPRVPHGRRGGRRPLPAPGAAGAGQRAHPRLGHRLAGQFRSTAPRVLIAWGERRPEDG